MAPLPQILHTGNAACAKVGKAKRIRSEVILMVVSTSSTVHMLQVEWMDFKLNVNHLFLFSFIVWLFLARCFAEKENVRC
jgi:hypothetical protein